MTTRRKFLRTASGLLLAPGLVACGTSNGTEDVSTVSPAPAAPPKGSDRKLGIALLGLGSYAKGQIAPALQLTEHCELRGLITGSPEKLPEWREKYGVPEANCYTYETMGEIAGNDDIDVVYVITPTATHRDFTVAAANAGKHVWCEKPMAMTVEECREMIAACDRNGVVLTIGYRMQHEPNTRDFIELTKQRAYGAIQSARSLAGYGGSVPPADYWRGQRDMGGGALYDMGVYTINGLRYATRMMPTAVLSASQDRIDRPNGTDLTTSYRLQFPDGVTAEGKTSVVEKFNLLRVEAENGWYEMDPMQPYQGVKGRTSDGKVLGPPVKNQQSIQMDNDALAILNGTEVIAPGREGLLDVAIIRAVIESAETGREVTIEV